MTIIKNPAAPLSDLTDEQQARLYIAVVRHIQKQPEALRSAIWRRVAGATGRGLSGATDWAIIGGTLLGAATDFGLNYLQADQQADLQKELAGQQSNLQKELASINAEVERELQGAMISAQQETLRAGQVITGQVDIETAKIRGRTTEKLAVIGVAGIGVIGIGVIGYFILRKKKGRR